jgi:hypothetical protein
MSLVGVITNQQTVVVATEVALCTLAPNQMAVPAGSQVVLSGSVSAATGTGGTTPILKVRQGTGIAGTQVGPTYTPAAVTANSATTAAIQVVDSAPPANGVYTLTLTYTGNSSSVVNSSLAAEFIDGPLV